MHDGLTVVNMHSEDNKNVKGDACVLLYTVKILNEFPLSIGQKKKAFQSCSHFGLKGGFVICTNEGWTQDILTFLYHCTHAQSLQQPVLPQLLPSVIPTD